MFCLYFCANFGVELYTLPLVVGWPNYCHFQGGGFPLLIKTRLPTQPPISQLPKIHYISPRYSLKFPSTTDSTSLPKHLLHYFPLTNLTATSIKTRHSNGESHQILPRIHHPLNPLLQAHRNPSKIFIKSFTKIQRGCITGEIMTIHSEFSSK